MVLPATAAAVISRGEFPRPNPSIFTLRRSPARTTPSFSRFEASRTASSEVAAGITALAPLASAVRSEEHTSELQSRLHLVCRLLLEKKKKKQTNHDTIQQQQSQEEHHNYS